jgi:transcriptional regulator with XRE-family HTH domain
VCTVASPRSRRGAVIAAPHLPAPPPRPRPLLRTTLGEVLRRTRQEQGRTLADVARAAKVSMPYLSEVERGLKEASSEVLAAICDALDVELADVLIEVGRDLVGRAPVFRLDSIGGDRIARPARGSGDARCLLAA